MKNDYIPYYINRLKAFREKNRGKSKSYILDRLLEMKDFHDDEVIVYMIEQEIKNLELEIEIEKLRQGKFSPQETLTTKEEHKEIQEEMEENTQNGKEYVSIEDSRGNIYKVEANKKHRILHNAIEYCIQNKISFEEIDANILRVISRRTFFDTEHIRSAINKAKSNGLNIEEQRYYINWMYQHFKFNDLNKFPFLKHNVNKGYDKREKTA